MNDFYNPYAYLNQAQFNSLSTNIVKVNGINGATAYQMKPNQTTALFDENEDYFYFKTTDGAGFPSIRTFKFEEVTEPSSQYVTKSEYDKGIAEIKELIENGFKSIQKDAE